MMKVNDVVKVTQNLPCLKLKKDMCGVIVAVFEHPEIAYEIEFCNSKGETIIQTTLKSEQLTLC